MRDYLTSCYFLLIMVLMMRLPLYAQIQPRVIDSMVKELPKVKDTALIKLLCKLAEGVAKQDPGRGVEYGEQAFSLAKKSGWNKGLAAAHRALGLAYTTKYEYPIALEHCFNALKMYEDQKDTIGIIYALMYIGDVYLPSREFEKALDYYNRALKMRGMPQNTVLQAMSLCRVAAVYRSLNKPEQALEYYRPALDINKRLGLENATNAVSGNMAMTYVSMGRYHEGLRSLIYLYRYYLNAGNKFNACAMAGVIGQAYGDAISDTNYDTRSDSLFSGDRNSDLDTAIHYLKAALQLSYETGNIGYATNSALNLSKVEEMKGDYKASLETYKEGKKLYDSVFSESKNKAISALETERVVLLKDKQIEADRRNDSERKLLIAVTLLLVCIIFIVAHNYYKQKKLATQNASLADQKENLLQHKNILMREIHHRVKNNLQVISALLDLQSGTTEDMQTKNAIVESAGRVASIGLMHQMLYQADDITGIEIDKFLNDLFLKVYSLFRKPGQDVTLSGNLPNFMLDIDTATPLGLIANELITNSFKYAFEGRNGTINIDLEQKDGLFELRYTDSGPGLPEGYDIKTSTSTGITIIRNLSKQLGGKFVHDAAQKQLIIIFKDTPTRKRAK